jgi:hypothetical protein
MTWTHQEPLTLLELYVLIAASGTFYWVWCRLLRAVLRRKG